MVSVKDEAMDEVPLQDEDSIEFRLLMAYAERTFDHSRYQHLKSKTPMKKKDGATSNGEGPAVVDDSSALPKKEKKKSRRWKFTPQCLRPPKEKRKMKSSPPAVNAEEKQARSLAQKFRDIVKRLEKRDQERPEFRMLRTQCSIQHDGDGEEDVIANIVAFLRKEGDKINEQFVQEQSFFQRVQSCWSYSFFQRLTEAYVADMVQETEEQEEKQRSEIALCVHATTQLSAMDNHPMNRMFGFGARYLKENYSQWIKEHGGWEKVMGIPDTQKEEESEED